MVELERLKKLRESIFASLLALPRNTQMHIFAYPLMLK
jgi:hypothetical protein